MDFDETDHDGSIFSVLEIMNRNNFKQAYDNIHRNSFGL